MTVGGEKGVVQSYDAASGDVLVVHGAEAGGGLVDTSSARARSQLVAASSLALVEPVEGDAILVVQSPSGPGRRSRPARAA